MTVTTLRKQRTRRKMQDMSGRVHPGTGLLSPEDWQAIELAFELSSRERAVAELLFQGTTRDLIAIRLRKPDGTSISPETVRVYIDRLYRKLDVQDTVGMALQILKSVGRFRDAMQQHNTTTDH